MPPQILRRANAPIDWSVQAVANHPVLTSGVGACITAFASTEELMGVFLATICWEHAPQAIEEWAKVRTNRQKQELVVAEADLAGIHYRQMAIRVLDAFTSLSKRRSKLAHGYFGIVTDRANQFAWRQPSSAARRMAAGLGSDSMRASPKPKTWIYTPKDFAELSQCCADTFEKISIALDVLPIVKGFNDPLPLTSIRRREHSAKE
jgi:hypothetical protein